MAFQSHLPEGMSAWDDDIDASESLTDNSQIIVKLISTSDRVRAYVLTDNPKRASELLQRAGFSSEDIRRTLCG